MLEYSVECCKGYATVHVNECVLPPLVAIHVGENQGNPTMFTNQ